MDIRSVFCGKLDLVVGKVIDNRGLFIEKPIDNQKILIKYKNEIIKQFFIKDVNV